MHDLTAGDIGESVGHNLLVLPAILFTTYAILRQPGSGWTRAWLVVLVAFTLVRNVPGSPLAP